MSWFWMLVLWGLQGGIACAISQAKNQSGRDGFLMGVLLGPIGIIIALCLPKLPAPAQVVLPPAGWYPDPADPSGRRWWDGARWSGRTRRRGLPPMPQPYEPDAELL